MMVWLLVAVAVSCWPPVRHRTGRLAQLPSALLMPGVAAVSLVAIAPAMWPLSAGLLAAAALRGPMARRFRPATLTGQLPIRLELIEQCLRAGMCIQTAISAVHRAIPATSADRLADALAQTAALLTVGAQPDRAWEPVAAQPELAGLAAAARRSVHGGAGLAEAFAEQAALVRAMLAQRRGLRGARSAVAVTAPLGLCFLPAFICLGLAPVIIGLVSSLTLW